MVQGSSPSSEHFIMCIILTVTNNITHYHQIILSSYLNSNLGADTHQMGKRASAAGAGKQVSAADAR